MRRYTITPLLRGALEAALRIDCAIAGALQEASPDGKGLRLVHHHGLSPDFVDACRHIDFSFPTTCVQAYVERRRIVMRDMYDDPKFAPLIPLAEDVGFRAVQSAPLLDSSRRLRGVLSTHFADPHHPDPNSQADLDRCCRVAALALESRGFGVEGIPDMPAAAHAAFEAAVRLIATVRAHNLRIVLDAVIANLEVVVGELQPESEHRAAMAS